jgi:hypothetical protein
MEIVPDFPAMMHHKHCSVSDTKAAHVELCASSAAPRDDEFFW